MTNKEPRLSCPHCRAQITLSGQTSVCPACGRALAVNNALPPIFSDATEYQLILTAIDHGKVDQLQIISNIMNKNLIQVKQSVGNLPLNIIKNKAYIILSAIEKIGTSGICYKVEPNFPWRPGDSGGIHSI